MLIDTSNKVNSKELADEEIIRLVGFRVNPDVEGVEFYSLLLEAKEDRPLIIDEQLIFFTKVSMAPKIVERSDFGKAIARFKPCEEIDYCCDIAETLYLISSQGVDHKAVVLNCLNTLFDLIKGTNSPTPKELKRVLFAFADHLTFHRELEPFFEEKDISRRAIIDAIFWYLGAILTRARILTTEA